MSFIVFFFYSIFWVTPGETCILLLLSLGNKKVLLYECKRCTARSLFCLWRVLSMVPQPASGLPPPPLPVLVLGQGVAQSGGRSTPMRYRVPPPLLCPDPGLGVIQSGPWYPPLFTKNLGQEAGRGRDLEPKTWVHPPYSYISNSVDGIKNISCLWQTHSSFYWGFVHWMLWKGKTKVTCSRHKMKSLLICSSLALWLGLYIITCMPASQSNSTFAKFWIARRQEIWVDTRKTLQPGSYLLKSK